MPQFLDDDAVGQVRRDLRDKRSRPYFEEQDHGGGCCEHGPRADPEFVVSQVRPTGPGEDDRPGQGYQQIVIPDKDDQSAQQANGHVVGEGEVFPGPIFPG